MSAYQRLLYFGSQLTYVNGGATGTALDLRSTGRGFKSYLWQKLRNNLEQVAHTLCASVTKQYDLVRPRGGDALWLGRYCRPGGK